MKFPQETLALLPSARKSPALQMNLSKSIDFLMLDYLIEMISHELESVMLCLYSNISHSFVNPVVREYMRILVNMVKFRDPEIPRMAGINRQQWALCLFFIRFIPVFGCILCRYTEKKHFPCMIAMARSPKKQEFSTYFIISFDECNFFTLQCRIKNGSFQS